MTDNQDTAYYHQGSVQPDQQQQLQQVSNSNSAESLNQQPSTAEQNYATKGISGFFNRQKFQPQTQQLFYADELANAGYVDLTSNLTSGTKPTRGFFRKILPWNWVFLNPSTQTLNSLESVQV